MSLFMMTAVFVAGAEPHSTVPADGIAIGKRVVAAIKGKVPFQDADFAKPLKEADKVALRQLGKCRLDHIGYPLAPHPKRKDALIENPIFVTIGFECPRVPWKTPVGISLYFAGEKISKIEMHNADLMRLK